MEFPTEDKPTSFYLFRFSSETLFTRVDPMNAFVRSSFMRRLSKGKSYDDVVNNAWDGPHSAVPCTYIGQISG